MAQIRSEDHPRYELPPPLRKVKTPSTFSLVMAAIISTGLFSASIAFVIWLNLLLWGEIF